MNPPHLNLNTAPIPLLNPHDFENCTRNERRSKNTSEVTPSRKVDARLPEKGDSNSHGARPVHLIITMIKWIRTRRLSLTSPATISPGGASRSRSMTPSGISVASRSEHLPSQMCEDRVLDGPASGGKGSNQGYELARLCSG